ncbi:unnamed protein product [Heterosigma akashiwo]
MSFLQCSIRNSIGTITLSSKANRNALSVEMLHQLQHQLHLYEKDPSVMAIIIDSNVDGIFSSGHDLKEIQKMQQQRSRKGLAELFQLCSLTMQSITSSTIPVISKVDGIATAAGCQLVASSDLAYGTNQSTFCTPGVSLGLFCSTPATALGRTIHRKHAMEMLLTGRVVDANEAVRIGLLNRVFNKRQEMDTYVEKVAGIIAAKSPQAIRSGKPLFYEQLEYSLQDAYRLTSDRMVIDILSDNQGDKKGDCWEGIEAFLAKREPIWKQQ